MATREPHLLTCGPPVRQESPLPSELWTQHGGVGVAVGGLERTGSDPCTLPVSSWVSHMGDSSVFWVAAQQRP